MTLGTTGSTPVQTRNRWRGSTTWNSDYLVSANNSDNAVPVGTSSSGIFHVRRADFEALAVFKDFHGIDRNRSSVQLMKIFSMDPRRHPGVRVSNAST